MFFHAQFIISALLAASSVLGAPSAKRQDANPCDGLGTGAYSNLTNFQVAAFNRTGSNDHPYGAELALSLMRTFERVEVSALVVKPWGTESDWKGLVMVNGGVTAASPRQDVSTEVQDNKMPYFVAEHRSGGPPRSPPPLWCAVPSNEVTGKHDYHYLAAHGRYDLWSLCYEKYNESTGQYRLAYNVDKTKTTPEFDVGTCVPVYLTIVT